MLTSIRLALVAGVIGGLCGCAAIDDSSVDARAQRELVVVPADAQPVREVRWSAIRTVRPLNERMVLFDGRRRPYLLVLARPCRGLHRNSTIVYARHSQMFRPDRHGFGAMTSTMPGSGVVVPCVPDTLYAIRDGDVEQLIASVSP